MITHTLKNTTVSMSSKLSPGYGYESSLAGTNVRLNFVKRKFVIGLLTLCATVLAQAQMTPLDSVLSALPDVVGKTVAQDDEKGTSYIETVNTITFDDGQYAGVSISGSSELLSTKVTSTVDRVGIDLESNHDNKASGLIEIGEDGEVFITFELLDTVVVQRIKATASYRNVMASSSALDEFNKLEDGDNLESFLVNFQSLDPALSLALYEQHFLDAFPYSESIRSEGLYIGLKDEERYKDQQSTDSKLSGRRYSCECSTLSGNMTVNPGYVVNSSPDYIYGNYHNANGDFGNGVDWAESIARESAAFYLQAYTDANNASGTSTREVATGSEASAGTNYQRARFRMVCTKDGIVNSDVCGCSKMITVDYQADSEFKVDGREKDRFPPGDKRVETLASGGATLIVDRAGSPPMILDAGFDGLEMNCGSTWNFEDVLIESFGVAASIYTIASTNVATPAQIELLEDQLISYVGAWENVVDRSGACGAETLISSLLTGTTQVTLNSNEDTHITLATYGQAYASGFGKWESKSEVLMGGRLAAIVDRGANQCCSDHLGVYALDDVGPGSPVPFISYAQSTGAFFGLRPEWDVLYRYPGTNVDLIEHEVSFFEVPSSDGGCPGGPTGGVGDTGLEGANSPNTPQFSSDEEFPGKIAASSPGVFNITPDKNLEQLAIYTLDGRLLASKRSFTSKGSLFTLNTHNPNVPIVFTWVNQGETFSKIVVQ